MDPFQHGVEKVIRDADVNSIGTLAYVAAGLCGDIDIMGTTTRGVQTAFVQIKQAVMGARH